MSESSTDAANSKPIRLDAGRDLADLVADEDLVLVEFYTKNCGICASMEPVLGIVARATDATVAMVNPGEDLDLVGDFAIRSVPTFVLFEDGEEVGRIAEGFVESDRLVKFVENRGELDR